MALALQIGETEPDFRRYGIYFTPSVGPLAEFGASWLGWDCLAARPRPHPKIPGLPKSIEEITATPRKYGFHATLKPPFRLAEHTNISALGLTLERLCGELGTVVLDGLSIKRLGSFLALVPVGSMEPVSGLAARLVRGLDSFRAPSTEAELARRRMANLSPAQEEMLQKWGYPYVMNEFRFHMTLSGRLPEREAETCRHVLTPHFARLIPGRVVIDAVTLVGEDNDGRFHAVHRYPLTGIPAGM
ncbi:Protein RcsF [Candidatus Rhodobacter oscarellae]|uniref:Protein RcsF n=1 Tax=Candidatus Rhodobacter oscarellae TaxID=1675527 RepID=A0A0J9GUD5_9RHOB|nr:DUF1045 domain-containing protein [Candidatus Rhodobacter lobularis]KMW57193.1 Protein RcsF [Candidatus Rhodobacter lobularis]